MPMFRNIYRLLQIPIKAASNSCQFCSCKVPQVLKVAKKCNLNAVSCRSQFGTVTGSPAFVFSTSYEGNGEIYSSDELVPGPQMIERILNNLKKKDISYIVPIKDKKKMEVIIEPFKELISEGVRPEFLIDACVKKPELFRSFVQKGSLTLDILNILVDICGMSYENSMRLFATFQKELIVESADCIQQRLKVFSVCNISSGSDLGSIVQHYPSVLFAADARTMESIVHGLHSFFSRGEIKKVVTLNPHVLLGSLSSMESKFDYFYYCMGLEGADVVNCVSWHDLLIEEIIMRHEILVKTGRYAMPDLKKPQLKSENPNLPEIIDCDDEKFVAEVAMVSLEEWNIFKCMWEKLHQRASNEPLFRIVKPSMRKKFARMYKNENTSALTDEEI